MIPSAKRFIKRGKVSTSVGHRRAGTPYGSKVEMGGGIHGVARPDLFPVLIKGNPFAVADAVSAREDLIMAVRPSSGNGAWGEAQ